MNAVKELFKTRKSVEPLYTEHNTGHLKGVNDQLTSTIYQTHFWLFINSLFQTLPHTGLSVIISTAYSIQAYQLSYLQPTAYRLISYHIYSLQHTGLSVIISTAYSFTLSLTVKCPHKIHIILFSAFVHWPPFLHVSKSKLLRTRAHTITFF